MEKLLFKLDAFEGPLDLLLNLIKKNKVSIYDIPISTILDQYLEVISEMKDMDLDVSSEFLVLAATLLQIKSKMLVPSHEEETEEEDPRTELVERLVEYKKYKEVSSILRERENAGYLMYYRVPENFDSAEAEFDYSGLTVENLYFAYKNTHVKLERRLPPPKKSFSGIVGHEKVSIREKVKYIWKRLFDGGKVLFKDIFKSSKSRADAVATFLAVLELVKMKKILVEGNSSAGDSLIICKNKTEDFNLVEIEG